jgi:hypothetical protein
MVDKVNRGITDVKKEVYNIRILVNEKKYNDIIKKGLLIYNNYFEMLSDMEKIQMTYNMALSYKKTNMFQQCLYFIDKTICLAINPEYPYPVCFYIILELIIVSMTKA